MFLVISKRLRVTTLLLLLSGELLAQCVGVQSYTANPAPLGGNTYNPGTVVTFCYTMVGFTPLGNSWIEGWDVLLGPGWLPGSLTPVSPPANCGGGGGQWIWVNSTTSANSGQVHGPGYFMDLNSDGNPGNDWGDENTANCTWTFCFSAEVGSTPGASLSVNIMGLSDGEAGAWTSLACTGSPFPISNATVTNSPGTVFVTSGSTICSGQSTTLTASGATGYTWSPATGLSSTTGASVTASPASTTTYTVTGTGGCGSCTATTTVTVEATPTITISPPAPTTCSGQTTTLTASGANTYTWSPSLWLSATTGATVTSSAASNINYTVTGTTAAGCVGTGSVSISVSQPPNVQVSPSSASVCSGQSATLTASGAQTYTWSPATGLSATTGATVTASPPSTTTYTVTGTSAAGCIGTRTVTVAVAPVPNVTVNPANSSICAGSSVSLTAGGANSYSWSPASGLSATTGATVSASPATTTTYTVTGTSGACSNTATSTVTINPSLSIGITPAAPAICSGTSTTLTASGAQTYSWSPATGLSATTGATVTASPVATTTYTITGTDANGCTGTATVTVTVNSNPTITIDPAIPVVCNGNSITVTASGANTYSWSPATGLSSTTGTSVNASPANTTAYTVTGTSVDGCTANTSFTVLVTVVVSVNVTTSNPSCNGGSNGAAQGVIGSGSSPYTYLWSDGQTTNPAVGLPAGSISLTVTDAIGCSGNASATLSDPPGITSSVTAYSYPGGANVSCNGAADGSADLTVSGGNGPYTFLWSNGQTAEDLSNVPAGNYSVTITDANNCTATNSLTLTEPPAMTATLNSPTLGGGYNISCTGYSDGVINSTINNGVTPYTYLWSNGATTQNITNASAGNQSVTITDANGCSITEIITLTEPAGMSSSVTAATYNGGANVSCNGASDGSIDLTVTNASGAVTYLWNNGPTTEDINNLPAGNYSVVVTDVNGCTSTSSATLTEPAVLSGTLNATNISCYGLTDGSITANITGGTQPYNYNWTSGQATQTINNLSSGNYSLNITDDNGCVFSLNTAITEPAALSTSLVSSSFTGGYDISCNGASDGSIDLTVTDGVTPYTYQWNNGETTEDLSNIPAGNYSVTVNDYNGCTASDNITLTEPVAITATISSYSDATCFGGNDGSATVNVSGGNAPYTYLWETGQTSATVTNFTSGIHNVIITDASGCETAESITISEPQQLTVSVSAAASICAGQNTQIYATASGGTPSYSYNWSASPADASLVATDQNPTVSPLVSTDYTVTITDANGCSSTSNPVSITVSEPLNVSVTANGPTGVCPGETTSINYSATGGDGNYSWAVNSVSGNYSSPYTATPTATGYYVFTVTDNCGSSAASDSILITLNPLPVIDFTADTLVGCEPLSVKFIDNTMPPAASHHWDFGDNNSNTNTSSSSSPTHTYYNTGTYSVSLIATTAEGCVDSLTINDMIEVFPMPVANFSFDPQTENVLEALISFNDESSGAHSWHWDFGDDSTSTLTNPQHLYTDTGRHIVWLTVTSQGGCKDSAQALVRVTPDYMIYIPNAFTPDGNGVNDGFGIHGEGIKEDNFEFRIFNRWGEQVFSTFDPNGKWYGDFNGNGTPLEGGVYVYSVLLKNIHNKLLTYKGYVVLVR